MKKIFIILPFFLLAIGCFAQSDTTKPIIAIVARSYSNHIILRYIPTTPVYFAKGNEVGYVVERALYKEGANIYQLNYTPVNGSPFKRWNDSQWDNAIEKMASKDSVERQLAEMTSTFSQPGTSEGSDNILKDGLKSLKEQKDNADMRFGFSLIGANRSKVAAEGLGLSVTDNDVIVGQTYVYRIHINQPVKNAKLEMAYIKVKCEAFDEKYLNNGKLLKINEGDEKVSFSFPESREYYAFTVRRSDDGGNSYKNISSSPRLNLKPQGYNGKTDFAFADTGLINYKKYTYRVFVATPFADELLLSEFTAMPRDKTPPPAPFLKSADHINPKQVELSWEIVGPLPGDLKGFNIKRSNKMDGIYTTISKTMLPPKSNKYIDEKFDTADANYYIVQAIDTSGNVSQSYPAYVTLIDNTPPAAPIISSAIIDSVGKITIKIKPNTEKDFMGYQLLKANARDHEFSVVQETYKDSLGATTFTLFESTTLNTLTKNIYYKLIALDTHFNQSESSKIIELTKRDTIPPVSPAIIDFSINDTSVIIHFANSSSEDAVDNILLRREVGKEKYDSVFNNKDVSITKFIDKKIIGGQTYEYAMVAKDDGGLISIPSRSLQLKTLLNNKIPTPLLKGFYDEKLKGVSLSFVIDEKIKGKKVKIEIYKRANKTSRWVSFKTIDIDKNSGFTDDALSGQKTMIYIIRLIDDKNNTSNFSKEIELQIPIKNAQ